MKNEALQEILTTYKSKSNKDLSNVAMSLYHDFESIKAHMIELTETVGEIEEVYNKVMAELQTRLKFEDLKKPSTETNASGD